MTAADPREGLQSNIGSMRNFADVADRCELTEGNASAAIRTWADMLEALSRVRPEAVGFQYRARQDTTDPWSDWYDPQGLEHVDHYLCRPQTFDIRYVYTASELPTKGEGGWSAEDACEQFIAAEVDSAPEALRRLGDWLNNVLDEDEAKTASRMVLGAMIETSAAIRAVDAPQPSDPADAEAYPTGNDRDVLNYLMQQFDCETWECEKCGHAEDTATMDSAHYLRQYLATPPTAQRHDEGAELVRMWERHAREYYVDADDTSNALSDELRLDHRVRGAMCRHHAAQLRRALDARGAGAAVEAVAWRVEWDNDAHVQYHDESDPLPDWSEWEDPPSRIIALGPITTTQQRSEQVVGGGGVGVLREALEESLAYFEARENIGDLPNEETEIASGIRAALSPQPLLSDQPAGVSNSDIGAIRSALVVACQFHDTADGLYRAGMKRDVWQQQADRLDAAITALDSLSAALHPDKAKDGAAG